MILHKDEFNVTVVCSLVVVEDVRKRARVHRGDGRRSNMRDLEI